MITNDHPGERNATPLLSECSDRILDDWHGGSRDRYHIQRATLQARSTIDVLRERGLLTLQGLEILERDFLAQQRALLEWASPNTKGDNNE